MLVYVDSSALVKRVSEEQDTAALRAAMDASAGSGTQFVTSALARVEVSRAMRARADAIAPADIASGSREAFVGVAIADLVGPVLETARVIGPPLLRSLDAIHLATAVALGADEVWTYDAQMAEVAEELGIPARSPS
jgi:predicted nucleic acid-binding protein